LAILEAALELALPPGDGTAEVLQLGLLARWGTEVGIDRGGNERARDRLATALDPDRSLPLDTETAHALIVLGDVAAATGDDALAVGSYARALRLLSMLREELES
jgi:hypothetical protein